MSLKGPARFLGLTVILALTHGASAADVVVRQFVGGSGENAIGVVEATRDTEIDGPQALTTDETGRVYLLDQVNKRIVQFDPKAPANEPRILGRIAANRPYRAQE
jgi:hypothetical protein